MNTVTRTAFATKAGVSPPAISRAIREGRVVLTPDKNVDPEHPTNRMYLETQIARRQAAAMRSSKENATPRQSLPSRPLGRAPAAAGARPRDESEYPDDPEADRANQSLAEQKLRSDIRYKETQTKKVAVELAQRLGTLVEREIVQQMVQQLAAGVTTNLLSVPRRIAARVGALARSGAPDQDIETAIAREIELALKRAKLESVNLAQ